MVMIANRAEIERELREHWMLLADTPDRGYDSSRKRAKIQADIDALLDLLIEEL